MIPKVTMYTQTTDKQTQKCVIIDMVSLLWWDLFGILWMSLQCFVIFKMFYAYVDLHFMYSSLWTPSRFISLPPPLSSCPLPWRHLARDTQLQLNTQRVWCSECLKCSHGSRSNQVWKILYNVHGILLKLFLDQF